MNRVLVLLATYLTCTALGQQTNCDDVHFQHCSASMANMVGVSNIGLWNDYSILRNAFQAQFTKTTGSVDGLAVVCNALQQFYLCLGQANMGFCLGVNGLIGKGLSPAQAYSFDGLFQQYQFMCGAGFYTAEYSNPACLQRVTMHYNATLQGCVQTYQTNIQHDPSQACTYASQLLNCYQSPFSTNCAPNANVASWWSCETQRRFVMAQFLTCGLTCSLNPTKAFEEHLKTHHKIEKDVHWYKLPDVFVLEEGKPQLTQGQWITE